MTTKDPPSKPSTEKEADKTSISDGSSCRCDSLTCEAQPNIQPPSYASVRRGDGEENDGKVCRICLEDDQPEMMIAPCRCKGSSKWVHRDCLDEWRTNERDRAFATCTECLFEYHLVPPQRQNPSWRRKATFAMLVSRDLCVLTFLMQIAIGLLGGFIYLCDPLRTIPACINADKYPIAAYYLFGFFALLVCLGFYGSIMLCMNDCSVGGAIPEVHPSNTAAYGDRNTIYRERHQYTAARGGGGNTSRQSQPRRSECCDNCCHNTYFYPVYLDGGGPPCCCYCCVEDSGQRRSGGHSHPGGGCSCDCCPGGDCGDGDCIHVICCLLLIAAIVMAVLGFFTGIVLTAVAFQRIVQRHIYLLHKRRLVNEFQVRDLAVYDLDRPIIADEEQQAEQINHQNETAIVDGDIFVPAAPPAPVLSNDDTAYLAKIGLK